MKKRNLVIIAVIWLVVLVAGASSAITTWTAGNWSAGFAQGETRVVSQAEYESIQRYSRLEEVRKIVQGDYYIPVEEDTLLLGAVRGMLESLNDTYTFYYTAEEMQTNTEHNAGIYQGIGITLAADKQGKLVILRVFRDTPAKRVGLQAGDILTAINGVSVSGEDAKAVDEAVALIRQSGENDIELTLNRDDAILRYTVRCEQIIMNRVEYRLLDDTVGYIQITEFLGDDVEGFREALSSFNEVALSGIVIDLRSNTGGYLDHVVDIADMLLPEGLIVYTEDRYGYRIEEHSDAKAVSCPVVCLVNSMSASASEVLAGAVQDYGIGAIIGETTFGKGIVQTVLTFDDGAGMQLTTATYFTPSGRSIHGIGIEPDYTVADDENTSVDETLEFALQWLEERNG